MKICYFFTRADEPSGGARIVFEHTNRLFTRGHEVELWTLGPTNPAFSCLVPIKQVSADCDSIKNKVNSVDTSMLLNPDIFVAVGFPLAYAYKNFPKAKSFWYLQHDETMFWGNLKEIEKTAMEALELPIHLLVNSAWTQERIKVYGRQSTLIPYGLNHQLFHPHEPILTSDIPTIAFVYDIQIWKGKKDFFEAMQLVAKRIPKLRIILISKVEPEEMCFYDLEIKLFIRPEQEKLRRIYSSASVFVSSSWAEGFGLPGLEAMACGVPVVTTDSGGVREYAIPEETAIVVPPRNPESLAEGILRVLKDKSLSQKLIQNGLKKAKEFDWEKSIDKLERVFKN